MSSPSTARSPFSRSWPASARPGSPRSPASSASTRAPPSAWSPRSRRTGSWSRPPSAGATASGSACSASPARPPPGSTWSRRPVRSAASSRPTPGETVNIAVLSESSALYLDQVAGSSALQPHNWVGQHIPLHATSNGKVLLSGLDDAQVNDAARHALALHRHDDHQEGQAPRGARPGPRAGVRRRRRRARGGTDRRGGPDPQRARRRGRLDERVRADVPAVGGAGRGRRTTARRGRRRGLAPPRLGSALTINAESQSRALP